MRSHTGNTRNSLAFVACATFVAVACSAPRQSTTAAAPATTPPAADEHHAPAPRPMAVTGCLQESGRGTYILTTLNEPKRPDSSTPKAISNETLAAAEHSYRLSSSRGRELRPLVGKSVHVEGTLVERSDLLKTGEKSNQTAATAGVQSDHKAAGANERITATDLAEIDVAAVQKVANNCGHVAKRPRSKR